MKTMILFSLFILLSCGKEETKRCRGQEEMIMRCQLDYIEHGNSYLPIPDWIKTTCQNRYPFRGCF